MSLQMPVDARYTITVFDESGAVITYDLDRQEMDQFRLDHYDDDLNYAIEYGVPHHA